MKPLRMLEVALMEKEEQLHYLFQAFAEQDQAFEFETEIKEGMRRIRESPRHFSFVPGQAPFRWYGPTRKYSYRISFLELEMEIIVIALFYSGTEDPLYWLDRDLR